MELLFNPLLEDLSKLKDSEIEAKVLELGKKYTIAARTGMGQVIPQILVTLEAYRAEMAKRSQRSLDETSKKINGDLDGLINID